jgi:anti-sigma B factor antagonist
MSVTNGRALDGGQRLSTADPITTSVAHREGVTVLTVAGEVDLATAPVLEGAITTVLAENPSALVIDLSPVLFLASAGLQILVATQEKLSGADFAVVANGPATSRPIQLTGLDEIFPLYPVLDDALSALRTRATE